ncbi:MAG: hypothetical protein AAF431_12405 [Pseudomonadota bacterium]
MYVRFQGKRQNRKSSSRLGIFQLAFELRDEGDIPKYQEEILLENIAWLKEYLKSPAVLRDEENFRAISWFHPRADEPIKKIREIKVILEEHGYHIDQVTTRDPGEVIYEDGFQIVAKPRKKTT